MRSLKTKKYIAAILAVLILISAFPNNNFSVNAADSELSLSVSCPFDSSVEFELNGSTVTSNSYRIPSMVTLADGTIVAAADIRWNTTYDGGGLDTLVARSKDGGLSWEYTVANYLGDNGNEYSYNSTCFIDPCLTVAADGQTIYMLCDLYPYGIALNGNGNQQTPSTMVGFNSSGYLLLSGDNHSSYSYYLKDGAIYSSAGSLVSGYTVDEYFNLYYNDQLTSNLFYSDSPYKVVRTGFLYLTSSTDGGETWSAPTLLNLKTSSEYVCLVGPGRGLTTSNGTMVFPVYSYSGTSGQRTGFVYSSDGVNWKREQCDVSWSSEAAVVEIGKGTLRFFYRNGTAYLCYIDYDMNTQSWGSYVDTGIAINSNTQLSAITYSQTSDGKQVVLLSCPTGPNAEGSTNNNGGYRLNGRIFAGVVASDGTMSWTEAININGTTAESADTTTPYTEEEGFFAYSCLTERSDGSVAILYENRENEWGAGDNCYYGMNMKAYSADSLGVEFDKISDSSEAASPTNVISANGVTVFSDTALFSGLTVTKLTAPTADYIKNAIAYDIIPTTVSGAYTGCANVTIAIPDGWDPSKVYGYVKESDGTLTILAGKASTTGSFTYTTPHFSETGLLELTDSAEASAITVVLDIEETSDVITVSNSANVGTEGTFTTDNVTYTVSYVSQEATTVVTKADSIQAGDEIIICDGNGNYLARNDTSIVLVSTPEEATVWTVGEGYTLLDGTYYLRARKGGTSSLNVSETNKNNTWSYDSSTGFYYSDSNYYLCFDGSAWDVSRNATSGYGAAYTLSETEAVSTTTVTFTGTDVTTGDEITIGNTTYTVIVNPKTVEESKFLKTGNTLTLDALTDLGLSGDYTVTYMETADESNAITVSEAQISAGTAIGEATVTALVRSESGNTVGTATYTITVSDIVVNDVQSIYVPVNGKAIIEGLSGEIYTGMLDESIATYSVDDSGIITFTGVAEGKTTLVVGTTQINVYVNPENFGSGADTEKYIYINVAEITNCTIYYAINGGTLYMIEGTGVLINQTYYDGFNIMFFGVPDEGYVLTQMAITNSAEQYYSLTDGTVADGSGSSAWPFVDPEQTTIPETSDDTAWKSGHGFRWSLLEGNITIAGLRDLFTRALALGAEGTTTFTKNGTVEMITDVSFIAEQLPTLEKTILSYKRDGITSDYTNGTTLEFGDVVTYQFTITTNSETVTYSDVTLSDNVIGYTNSTINGDSISVAGTYTYTADYTISSDDLAKYVNGTFINSATLHYSYTSLYGQGQYNSYASASVSCKINGIVYYVWMEGLPEGITGDATAYPLPESSVVTYGSSFTVEEYTGTTTYNVVENGVVVGSWTFKGWQYNGTTYNGGEALTMPNGDSVEFVGIWEYAAAPTYTVTYEWENAPSATTLPIDSGIYYSGQTYTVDSTYSENSQYDDGTMVWSFSGWKLDGNIVSGEQTIGDGNVILKGIWTSEQKYTSLTIQKSGWSSADENQSFIFSVVEVSEAGDMLEGGVSLTVAVSGNGSVTVDGLTVGSRYRISELTGWSWRYGECTPSSDMSDAAVNASDNSIVVTVTESADANLVTFQNKRTADNWLSGDSWCNNIFK